MKIYQRLWLLGMVLGLAAGAYSQVTVEECNSIYNVVTTNELSRDIAKLEQAISSGKEYVAKCKDAGEGADTVIKYIAGRLPIIEERLTLLKLERSYNDSRKQRRFDEMIASGKQLIDRNRPYALDVMLDIASVGFDNATAKIDKYNADAIKYANLAIEKMATGAKSGNEDRFGYYVSYKNDRCADGKSNAIGWMNYTIGYIKFARENKPKDAFPYLYKASQDGCETKSLSENYRLIGSWYVDEAIQIGDRRKAQLTAAGDQETPETSALLELQMGYVDRAIDAYARASRTAAMNPKASPAYKDALLNKVKELFAARYDGDTSKMDAFVSKVLDAPFPDPSTPVEPVKTTP